jgi:hypothetical protein
MGAPRIITTKTHQQRERERAGSFRIVDKGNNAMVDAIRECLGLGPLYTSDVKQMPWLDCAWLEKAMLESGPDVNYGRHKAQ